MMVSGCIAECQKTKDGRAGVTQVKVLRRNSLEWFDNEGFSSEAGRI